MPLRDEISPIHEELIKKCKVTHFLDMEVPAKNEKIVEGKWQLTEEEKMSAINRYYGLKFNESKAILEKFKPTEHFLDTLRQSFVKNEEHQLNIQNPTLLDLTYLYDKNNFKTIGGETKDATKVLKDETGKPILDDENKIIRVEKAIGEIVWTNNKGNINDLINTYNIAFPDEPIYNPFTKAPFSSIPSMTGSFDINLFAKNDMYLYISGRPMDILNQSMTNFYSSCQTLYSNGLRPQLANALDKNTKIAYLMFETPWVDQKKKVYPFTAFSRMFIRVANGQIFFDNVYPDRLRGYIRKMVEEKTGMKNEFKGTKYNYTTPDEYATHGYMDILQPKWKKEISLEELLKDIRIKNLSEHFKMDPMNIDRIEDKAYETENGQYLVYTDEELRNDTIEAIKNAVYKQDIYAKYLNLEEFFDKEDKFLKGYKGEKDFDELSKWAEKKKITKHNLFRQVKPYLVPEFWDERLTPEKIDKKIKAFSSEEPVEIGDNLKAYKTEEKKKKKNAYNPPMQDDFADDDDDVRYDHMDDRDDDGGDDFQERLQAHVQRNGKKKKRETLMVDPKVVRFQILNPLGRVIAAMKLKSLKK